MTMKDFEFYTAVNHRLWQEYAEKSVSTWQHQPRIFWEHDATANWQAWRQGDTHDPREATNFALTCRRFSHKVEAHVRQWHLCEHRYQIWLDADVVQCKPIPDSVLEPCLPREGELFTYLGRGPTYHPDSAWIAMDRQHPLALKFLARLEQTYLQDLVYALHEWHDAWVWNWLCEKMDTPRRTLSMMQGAGHAMTASPLGEYFVHLKGARKQHAEHLIQGKITPQQALRKPPKKQG